jgi:hypothetical protein
VVTFKLEVLIQSDRQGGFGLATRTMEALRVKVADNGTVDWCWGGETEVVAEQRPTSTAGLDAEGEDVAALVDLGIGNGIGPVNAKYQPELTTVEGVHESPLRSGQAKGTKVVSQNRPHKAIVETDAGMLLHKLVPPPKGCVLAHCINGTRPSLRCVSSIPQQRAKLADVLPVVGRLVNRIKGGGGNLDRRWCSRSQLDHTWTWRWLGGISHTIVGRQDNCATRMEKMLKRLMGDKVQVRPESNTGSVEMVLE